MLVGAKINALAGMLIDAVGKTLRGTVCERCQSWIWLDRSRGGGSTADSYPARGVVQCGFRRRVYDWDAGSHADGKQNDMTTLLGLLNKTQHQSNAESLYRYCKPTYTVVRCSEINMKTVRRRDSGVSAYPH